MAVDNYNPNPNPKYLRDAIHPRGHAKYRSIPGPCTRCSVLAQRNPARIIKRWRPSHPRPQGISHYSLYRHLLSNRSISSTAHTDTPQQAASTSSTASVDKTDHCLKAMTHPELYRYLQCLISTPLTLSANTQQYHAPTNNPNVDDEAQLMDYDWTDTAMPDRPERSGWPDSVASPAWYECNGFVSGSTCFVGERYVAAREWENVMSIDEQGWFDIDMPDVDVDAGAAVNVEAEAEADAQDDAEDMCGVDVHSEAEGAYNVAKRKRRRNTRKRQRQRTRRR